MTNAEIESLLAEAAALLELECADVFRVRAYQRAVRAAGAWSAALDSHSEAGLMEIPGVGKSLAAHIREACRTGTFPELEALRGRLREQAEGRGIKLTPLAFVARARAEGIACPIIPGIMPVTSAQQMLEAVNREIAETDIFISVAAVADYRPRRAAEHKIKKDASSLTLELEANPDILAEVATMPDAPFCVGFAAESRDLATYAESKRAAKKLDLVVGNLVQDGLGGNTNAVTLFDAAGAHTLPLADKSEVAHGIVAHLAALMEERHGQH